MDVTFFCFSYFIRKRRRKRTRRRKRRTCICVHFIHNTFSLPLCDCLSSLFLCPLSFLSLPPSLPPSSILISCFHQPSICMFSLTLPPPFTFPFLSSLISYSIPSMPSSSSQQTVHLTHTRTHTHTHAHTHTHTHTAAG